MLTRSSILASLAAVIGAALFPGTASAYLLRVGPHPMRPGLLPARVHGCPTARRVKVCVHSIVTHSGPPRLVCVQYEWVNKCTA
jgi:hypothetical protein